MIIIAGTVAVLLAVGFGSALIRIVRGPSSLDRIVANDALLAITVGAIATEAAYTRDATGLPILLGLALLGPIASIAVGRFADPASPVVGATPSNPDEPRSDEPPEGTGGAAMPAGGQS